jgi:L-rhamnose mutarotase
MRSALAAAGWRDYSLFLREDGLLVGYLVTDDFDRARAAIKSMPVNERWQETVKSLFESLDQYPDDVMQPLDEVFHLVLSLLSVYVLQPRAENLPATINAHPHSDPPHKP